MDPFPLMLSTSGGDISNRLVFNAKLWVDSEMWICIALEVDSIREAVLTVSPMITGDGTDNTPMWVEISQHTGSDRTRVQTNSDLNA